jgi:hypothetical protein
VRTVTDVSNDLGAFPSRVSSLRRNVKKTDNGASKSEEMKTH